MHALVRALEDFADFDSRSRSPAQLLMAHLAHQFPPIRPSSVRALARTRAPIPTNSTVVGSRTRALDFESHFMLNWTLYNMLLVNNSTHRPFASQCKEGTPEGSHGPHQAGRWPQGSIKIAGYYVFIYAGGRRSTKIVYQCVPLGRHVNYACFTRVLRTLAASG